MNYDKDPWAPRPVDTFPFDFHKKSRQEAIRMQCCVRCGGEAEIFADFLSEREYAISGYCQSCQDWEYALLDACSSDV
jgi:hypothetical protein